MKFGELFLSNNFLKICSLIMGYAFWIFLSQSVYMSLWFEVPISFYNTNTSYKISSPESIKVLLKGKRSTLYNIDKKNLALHIDSNTLKEGNQKIKIFNSNLFIPNNIEILDSNPVNAIINYEKNA